MGVVTAVVGVNAPEGLPVGGVLAAAETLADTVGEVPRTEAEGTELVAMADEVRGNEMGLLTEDVVEARTALSAKTVGVTIKEVGVARVEVEV